MGDLDLQTPTTAVNTLTAANMPVNPVPKTPNLPVLDLSSGKDYDRLDVLDNQSQNSGQTETTLSSVHTGQIPGWGENRLEQAGDLQTNTNNNYNSSPNNPNPISSVQQQVEQGMQAGGNVNINQQTSQDNNTLIEDSGSLTIEPLQVQTQQLIPVNNHSGVNVSSNYPSDILTSKKESNNESNNESVNYHDPNIGINNPAIDHRIKKKSAVSGLFKLLVLILIPLMAVGATVVILVSNAREKAYQKEKEILVSVSMKNVNWQDLGNVFEPVITLPVKTASSFQDWEFLIDSGAVISSLPSDWAEKTGQDLAFLKRSTFRGFGGKTSFAYQGEMLVRLGEEEIKLPVVFTEASGTKSLLGRKGFFENYSLYFNHKDKKIEIRK